MSDAILILLPFLGFLVVVIYLRVRSKGAIEVKTTDAVLAAVTVALWLVASGRIESLTFGDFTIRAFQHAAAEPAALDAQPLAGTLPVETVRAEPKSSVSAIPDLIAHHTQALTFRLGARGYVGDAVRQYFKQLADGPDLRWMVIEDDGGRFWGLADARSIESQARNGLFSIDAMTEHLNEGGSADREWLAVTLPDFMPANLALQADATRQQALQRFGKTTAEFLPALDPEGRLRGMVRRDALVTGLLADVTARLDAPR